VDDDQHNDENLAGPEHSHAKEYGDIVINDPAQEAGQRILVFESFHPLEARAENIMRLHQVPCFLATLLSQYSHL
jgi:hypothetical protein